jgi:hypothetical protein
VTSAAEVISQDPDLHKVNARKEYNGGVNQIKIAFSFIRSVGV